MEEVHTVDITGDITEVRITGITVQGPAVVRSVIHGDIPILTVVCKGIFMQALISSRDFRYQSS